MSTLCVAPEESEPCPLALAVESADLELKRPHLRCTENGGVRQQPNMCSVAACSSSEHPQDGTGAVSVPCCV